MRAYPPVSFEIIVKGEKGMEARIVERPETTIYGISAPLEGQGDGAREALRHNLWSDACEDVPGVLYGRWNEAGSTACDGVWYGVWHDGRYMIAREAEVVRDDMCCQVEKTILLAGLYAAFRTGKGGRAWEEMPRLFEQIFELWLPSSGYEHWGDWIIEALHLWADHDKRQAERYYEVWFPIQPV